MWLATFLFISSNASAEPVLAITGSCPGSATAAVAAITPGGRYAIVKGDGMGSDLVPAGVCAGLETGLSGLSLVTVRRDADGDGIEVLSPTLPASVCSSVVQVIDIDTCEVSETFDMLSLVGSSGGITPGDTASIVTTDGGPVFDPDDGDTHIFGSLDFRCVEWSGSVCTNFQTRVGAESCATLDSVEDWHRHVYVNTPEDRSCPLICAATTGNPSWDVCRSSGESNTDAFWAYSWSQRDTACETDKYIWRTQGIPNQCDPYCLNIANGSENYAGSPNLEIQCSDW